MLQHCNQLPIKYPQSLLYDFSHPSLDARSATARSCVMPTPTAIPLPFAGSSCYMKESLCWLGCFFLTLLDVSATPPLCMEKGQSMTKLHFRDFPAAISCWMREMRERSFYATPRQCILGGEELVPVSRWLERMCHPLQSMSAPQILSPSSGKLIIWPMAVSR